MVNAYNVLHKEVFIDVSAVVLVLIVPEDGKFVRDAAVTLMEEPGAAETPAVAENRRQYLQHPWQQMTAKSGTGLLAHGPDGTGSSELPEPLLQAATVVVAKAVGLRECRNS